MIKVKVTRQRRTNKVEQLQAVLQQKEAQLAKLQRVQRVLLEREQVVSQCIAQQGDMLHHLGRMCFSLPDKDDAEYERKAKAAVEALLKDMEAAQLLQQADAASISMSPAACSSHSSLSSLPQKQQQQQQQQQEPCEHYTNRLLHSFLSSPECVATIQRVHNASLEELAALNNDLIMKLSLAVVKYPAKHYITQEAADALPDASQRSRQHAANAKLQAALDAYMNLVNLLHTIGDKVLDLSLLNTETMQPETPDTAFWENVGETLQLREPEANQLHMAFLWYSLKRSTLIEQMQQTMQQLQQLLGPVQQQQQQDTLPLPQQLQQAPLMSGAASPIKCGAGGGSSSSSGSSSSNGGGSSSGAGLNLDMLEDADNILQDLGRLVWRLRETSRCLIYRYCNVLDPYQLSMSILHSYPYIGQPPPIIETVVKKRVAAQQQQEKEAEAAEERRRQQQQGRRRQPHLEQPQPSPPPPPPQQQQQQQQLQDASSDEEDADDVEDKDTADS
ncbi:hypothetical protein OEZ86_008392 [Tetradesmus obliquus]|nr:hypothetical protein OEZ86_008392 [Tetradesmus obliquus]